MAHSKAFMLEEMHKNAGAIMTILLEEDVQIKPDYLHIPENSEKLRADFIRPAFHWLKEVYAREYYDVREVKKLLPDHIWKRYKDWGGFDEHRECVMLREALSQLRRAVVARTRPDFFKKTIIAKKFKEIAKSEQED